MTRMVMASLKLLLLWSAIALRAVVGDIDVEIQKLEAKLTQLKANKEQENHTKNVCPPHNDFLAFESHEVGKHFFYYCIPSEAKHRPAIRSMFKGQIWEPATHKAIAKVHVPGTSIIHSGTFFGDFVPFLCTLMKKADGFIYAFEPNRDSFDSAQGTLLANKCVHLVNIINRPLSNQVGQILKFCHHSVVGVAEGGGSFVVRNDQQNKRSSKNKKCSNTTSLTIDSFLDATINISVIHLDVERSEQYALEGALETIERNRPVIITETQVPHFMSKHNYKSVKTIDANTMYCPVEKESWCRLSVTGT